MIVSYCPKKNYVVPMLLTMHSQPDVAATFDKKPKAINILCYNFTTGGVDTLDRMLRTLTCKRMTKRWPVALFYNMIDVSAVNAFTAWLQLNGESPYISMKKQKNFLLQLEKELAGVNTQPEPCLRFLISTASAQKRKTMMMTKLPN